MHKKITSGKWIYKINNDLGVISIRNHINNRPIAKIFFMDDANNDPSLNNSLHCLLKDTYLSRQEAVSNARLIASAPELYSACSYVISLLDAHLTGQDTDLLNARNVLQNAIKNIKE